VTAIGRNGTPVQEVPRWSPATSVASNTAKTVSPTDWTRTRHMWATRSFVTERPDRGRVYACGRKPFVYRSYEEKTQTSQVFILHVVLESVPSFE
jgi:hypothetical protein